MLTIDGSRFSGSGAIVRQAVAFAALTGRPIRVVNVRAKRDKPGLRAQHLCVIEAIAELVNGCTEGLVLGSREFVFRPGSLKVKRSYRWDIGSAGSTTMLALGMLPVLAYAESPVLVELWGGLFQDFAPSAFHLQHVVCPVLRRMGLYAAIDVVRPGYVPRGEGILRLRVQPMSGPLRAIVQDEAGPVTRVWGIALSSHLEERQVSRRMAEAAREVLAQAGYPADIEIRHDIDSLQPGAALALFADREPADREPADRGTADQETADHGRTVRLGADQAGAPRRRAESIGTHVAQQLLQEIRSGATVDRFAADQLIPFAALAEGESRFIIPAITDHVLTGAWLAEVFLGARVKIDDQRLAITGAGFRMTSDRTAG
ncbi:MAG: RNA 3'-terminal phosphate cyclase [Nitrospira sp.]|nr:RNA 3'-terminal phosphate cyclase [Nitrospira sp.]